MSEATDGIAASTDKAQAQASRLFDSLMAAAQPGAVFSAPVTSTGYTVITASEITAGGGFGFGGALGPGNEGTGGSGAGGGGGSNGRPVAVIIISADGVEIKPVLDITKLAIAGITAWGAMAVMIQRVFSKSK